jgi:hypothetical protein
MLTQEQLAQMLANVVGVRGQTAETPAGWPHNI